MFRSISNYRHWDLATTLGFPLLLWQNELWPGSPLAGSRQVWLSAPLKWQLVCGLRTTLGHMSLEKCHPSPCGL